MDAVDFRSEGDLRDARVASEGYGNLMLTPEEQAAFVEQLTSTPAWSGAITLEVLE